MCATLSPDACLAEYVRHPLLYSVDSRVVSWPAPRWTVHCVRGHGVSARCCVQGMMIGCRVGVPRCALARAAVHNVVGLEKTVLLYCSYCTSRCLSGVLIAVSCLHCALRETASGLLLHSADHVVALALCAHHGCVCSCLAGT